MDNFNVIVLMMRDKSTGILNEAVDSYKIESGMDLIQKIYLENNNDEYYIYLSLTTKDVEDWEYYGIYELYEDTIFNEFEIEVLDGSGDYNPKWILKFKYNEDRIQTEKMINTVLKTHLDELNRIIPLLSVDKERYMRAANEE